MLLGYLVSFKRRFMNGGHNYSLISALALGKYKTLGLPKTDT